MVTEYGLSSYKNKHKAEVRRPRSKLASGSIAEETLLSLWKQSSEKIMPQVLFWFWYGNLSKLMQRGRGRQREVKGKKRGGYGKQGKKNIQAPGDGYNREVIV